MSAIEVLRVDAIDVPHGARQIGLVCVQHQVIVIAHLAIGQNLRIKPAHGLPNRGQLRHTALVTQINRLTPVAARSDVMNGTWEFNAEGARHRLQLAENEI